jgi:hypothetical protein
MAIAQVREAIRRGHHWALKTDIEHFFSNINRKILESQLRGTFSDQGFCEMVLRANSSISDSRKWAELSERTEGLPQGNCVSPVLSNIYLNGFDEALSNLHYWRYADDILVLGSSRKEVVEAMKRIERVLVQLGLRLNQKKTSIGDLYRTPLVFLGYEIRGGNLYPPMKAILSLEQKLRIRGQEAQKINLMKGFVNRFRVGPVRKLFRRIDRELRQWYPGITLTGLLDHPASVLRRVGNSNEIFAGPKGEVASFATEKARFGQAPAVAVAGERDSVLNTCSLALMEAQ